MSVFRNPAFWKTYLWSHGYSLKETPDQTNKVAIVTGANSGLGYATAVALASKGATVYLACRNRQKAIEAIERAEVEIKILDPKMVPKLEFLELDLADTRQCDRAAKEFTSKGLPLDILVNNSGIKQDVFELTKDGIEKHFAVNSQGHFVFTLGLLEVLKIAHRPKVVVVSSLGHEFLGIPEGINFDTLNIEGQCSFDELYSRSKLANIWFTKALAKRVRQDEIYVNAVHPGFCLTPVTEDRTGMSFIVSKIADVINYIFAQPANIGCLTTLYCATSPEIEEQDITGKYFIPTANQLDPSPYARDSALAEKFWAFSVKLMEDTLNKQQQQC